MGYYDELINNIDMLIKEENYDLAKDLIDKELSMPYVPNDIDRKLREYIKIIPFNNTIKALNDEEIIEYLRGSEGKQLRAIEELDRKNLRDYIDICDSYLKSDGFINGKVLLIDSLIKQDISDEFTMINDGIEYSFIPRYVMSPETSIGFIKSLDILNDVFMKEPSKLEMAKQLLYKECLLALPINYEEDEAIILTNKIQNYIKDAFDD